MSQKTGDLLMRRAEAAKLRGHRRTALALYSMAKFVHPEPALARREAGKLRKRKPNDLAGLRFISLGTTGTCNASCVHCPTGKASTALSPRQTMPMELFKKIVDGIVAEGVSVEHLLAFGLFGDGLVDPLVLDRARYVREHLPDVGITVNTNGAAFNLERHAALYEYVALISLHCESLTPETFDYLMAPLRTKNLLPKYEAILKAFPMKVRISVPVSRANIGELESIKMWFMDRGAREVVFDPLASRCVEDMSLYNRLALKPHKIACGPDIATDFIVDCDGKVLACCQDFSRLEPIGDLATESFKNTLKGLARRNFQKKMAEGRHDELATCSRCFGDLRTPNFPFDVVPPVAKPA